MFRHSRVAVGAAARLAAGASIGAATVQCYSSSSDAAPPTLYASWFCPYVQRAWIAIEEKRVPYTYVEINPYEDGVGGRSTKKALPLEEKRRRYPEFVAASPRGLIPALAHDGGTVCDSLVVVEYIDEAFSDRSPLLPSNALERARCRQWSAFAGSQIIPHYYKMLMAQDAAGQAAARSAALEGLAKWSDAMAVADGPYFLGARFSFADLALFPWVERFLTVGAAYRNFELPDTPSFERLRVWHAAVRERPAVKATLCDRARLIENYSEYADNSATSDAAKTFRGA